MSKITITQLLAEGRVKIVRPPSAIKRSDVKCASVLHTPGMSVTQKQLVNLDKPLPYQGDKYIGNMAAKQKDADLAKYISRLSKPFAWRMSEEQEHQVTFMEREVIADGD